MTDISQHTEYHTAIESAINHSLSEYNIQCDLVRVGYYKVVDDSRVFIQSPSVSVECIKEVSPISITYHLSWTAPEYRENGDRLSINEIAGYEIKAKGVELLSIPAHSSYSGEYEDISGIKIRTVDFQGEKSEWAYF